jgi:hypothetical protein
MTVIFFIFCLPHNVVNVVVSVLIALHCFALHCFVLFCFVLFDYAILLIYVFCSHSDHSTVVADVLTIFISTST